MTTPPTLLAPAIALSAVLMCATGRFAWRTRLLVAQSACLAIVAPGALFSRPEAACFAIWTITIKCVLWTRLLHRRHASHTRLPGPDASATGPLLVATSLVALASLTAAATFGSAAAGVASGLGSVLVGAYLTSLGRDLLEETIGLLVVGNGVALAAIVMTAWSWPALGLIALLDLLSILTIVAPALGPFRDAADDETGMPEANP